MSRVDLLYYQLYATVAADSDVDWPSLLALIRMISVLLSNFLSRTKLVTAISDVQRPLSQFQIVLSFF